MKQKVLLFLTLLIWGGTSVIARNINADLSKGVPGNGATWEKAADSDTYTFTWSNWGNEVSLFEAFGGSTVDWSELTNINMTISRDVNPVITIAIVADGKSYTCTPYSGGARTFNLSNFKSNDGKVLTAAETGKITDIKFQCPQMENTLSATVSNVFVTISPKVALTFDANGKATIDLSKAEAYGGATCTYDKEKGLTITSDGSAGSYIEVVFDKTYDFTNTGKGTVVHEGDLLNGFRFSNGHEFGYSKYNPDIQNGISQGNDYTAITYCRLNLKAEEGTMTISDITFTAKPMTITDAHSTPIESLPNYAVDTNGNITENGKLASNYNTTTDIFLGDWSGAPDNFINIEDYDELRVYTNKENKFRAFMFKEAPKAGMTQGDHVATLGPDFTSDIITYNEIAGYYAAKIKDIKALYNGQAKIIGMKSAQGGNGVVSKITLYNEETTSEYDYTVSGQYYEGASLDEITNSDARTIDCTKLTGSDVKIFSGNPNCIVAVEKEGVVRGTANLAVNGIIDHLILTDGHSVKIPAGMTATDAHYVRTMPNTYGTIVLPFDAVSDDNVEFYTISAMNTNSITIEKVETLLAGTPAIIKKLNGKGINIQAANTKLTGSVNNTTDAVNMYGSFTQKEQVTDRNAYYILNDKFWQCNEFFYCNAFRAYFTPAANVPAANCLSLKESFGDPTLVDIVTGNTTNGIQGVYNTAGVKMQGLQKGINIVRLADGETKTVIIK